MMRAFNGNVPGVRPLPHHAEHRCELLAAIEAEEMGRPQAWRWGPARLAQGWFGPVAAAVAVLVIVAVALGVHSLLRPVGSPGGARPTGPAAGATTAGRDTASPTAEPSAQSGGQQVATESSVVSAPVSSLVVNDGVGAVTVTAGDSASVSITARVTYSGSLPQISRRVSGRTLTVGYPCGNCGVAFRITVPRQMNVTVDDGAGQVILTGLAGDLDVQAGEGAIFGTGLSAATARFQTGTGEIDVAFSAAPHQVTATSGTGAVVVRAPSSVPYQVTANGQLGSVNVALPQSASASHVITASAGLGSVTVEAS
jgi:hypothetical protein